MSKSHPTSSESEADTPASTWHHFFGRGHSVWLKIIGCAIGVPVIVAIFTVKAGRGNQNIFPQEVYDNWLVALGVLVLTGVFLGSSLAMKDVISERMKQQQPVSFPLMLMFGLGVWSAFAFWIPLVVLLTAAAIFAPF